MEMIYGQDELMPSVVKVDRNEDHDEERVEQPPQPPVLLNGSKGEGNDENRTSLNRNEIWNVSFCLLAWAFAVCNVTLGSYNGNSFKLFSPLAVVGTSNVILLSIGGSPRIASVPLGTFFVGAFIISCGLTGHLFRTQGRKFTFFVGIAISMLGTMLGGVSLMSKSPGLLSISTLCFGAANGIAFFLRFAAIELVPKQWAAKAVALVVSGGVIAAFAGPETSLATRGLFGPEEHLKFMGVFMMTGIFIVCKALCITAVTFPEVTNDDNDMIIEEGSALTTTSKSTRAQLAGFFTMYYELLQTKSFLVPLAVATLSWGIMSLPMSLLRVAMTQAGYSARDSLLVIELHFVGMYGTGFITGFLISKFGHKLVTVSGLFVSILSILLSLLTKEDSPKVIWVMSLLLLGIGWNLQFTAATVWLTKCNDTKYSKGQIQAANDSSMFLIAGIFTFSASYVFEAGGSNVKGWRVLNASVIALLSLLGSILLVEALSTLCRAKQTTGDKNQETPERLDSFDESIIDEINQELERERHTAERPNIPSGASTIIQDLETMDNDDDAQAFPGMKLNYGSGTDDDDGDTWPPPPPPYSSLRIIDIEEGECYRTNSGE